MDKQVIALLKYKIEQSINNHELNLDEGLEIKTVIDKQIPMIPRSKKAELYGDDLFIDNCACPVCKRLTKLPPSGDDFSDWCVRTESDYLYCPYCGQKLDLKSIKESINSVSYRPM